MPKRSKKEKEKEKTSELLVENIDYVVMKQGRLIIRINYERRTTAEVDNADRV